MCTALLPSVQFLPQKIISVGGWALFAGVVFFAAPVQAGSVGARTPFMAEAAEPPPAAPEPVPLELRGIVSTKSGYLFGIYDSTTHQSNWLAVNETAGALTVRSLDVLNDSITAEYEGRTITLSLKSAKVASLPPPALVSGSSPGPLEGVMKEVERRRNLRSAARSGLPPQQGLQK